MAVSSIKLGSTSVGKTEEFDVASFLAFLSQHEGGDLLQDASKKRLLEDQAIALLKRAELIPEGFERDLHFLQIVPLRTGDGWPLGDS